MEKVSRRNEVKGGTICVETKKDDQPMESDMHVKKYETWEYKKIFIEETCVNKIDSEEVNKGLSIFLEHKSDMIWILA